MAGPAGDVHDTDVLQELGLVEQPLTLLTGRICKIDVLLTSENYKPRGPSHKGQFCCQNSFTFKMGDSFHRTCLSTCPTFRVQVKFSVALGCE